MSNSSTPTTAEALPDDPQDRAAEDPVLDPTIECAERHRRMLARLLEISMTLAESVEQEALARRTSDEVSPPVDLALKLSRVSRCMRLTMALEMKTCEALRLRRAGFAVECEERRKAKADRARHAVDAREIMREQTMFDVMHDAIRAENPDREDREAVEAEMYSLLNEDEDYEDILDGSIGEAVVRLCKALNLTPDWSQWADQDWAIEEAETGAEGSPYAGGLSATGSETGAEALNGFDPQHPPPHPSS